MWVSKATLALGVWVVATLPAWAENAHPRGGDSGSGARHHTDRPADRPSAAPAPSRHDDRSSRDHSFATSDAQRRHPRPGTGSWHRGGRVYYGSPYRYGYYGSYPYGWYDYGYYGGYYGPYVGYGYRYRHYDNGSLRVEVEPEETRVYVDGYYAGVADDFDGIFQRLNVSPGRHTIDLKLEGYRDHSFRVYVPGDDTVKLHWNMVRGSGADATETIGNPPADYASRDENASRDDNDGDDDRDDRYAAPPPRRERDPRWDSDPPSRTRGDAMVRLDVRPGDASVYVDGEFRGTVRDASRLDLTPGRHRIEIVRPGYRTVERQVEVRPGDSTEIVIDLEKS